MSKRVHHLSLKNVEEVKAQLTVATLPLSMRVEKASDSVQKTAAVAGQVLERTSVAEEQTSKLLTEAAGALRK